MKRYSSNQKVPMKFHNLYVYLLNPLGILLRGALTAVVLLTALNVKVIPDEYNPFDKFAGAGGGTSLWLILGFCAFAFLFAIIAEVLLAKRRVLGVLILLADYVLNVASGVTTARQEPTTENLIALGVMVLISLLVCIYYWKRSRLFH